MKIIIFLLSIILLSANTSHAGSSFQGLSYTTEIVDMDKWVKAKLEAEEYARKQGAMIFTHSEVVE